MIRPSRYLVALCTRCGRSSAQVSISQKAAPMPAQKATTDRMAHKGRDAVRLGNPIQQAVLRTVNPSIQSAGGPLVSAPSQKAATNTAVPTAIRMRPTCR